MSRNPDIQRLLANLRGGIISSDEKASDATSGNNTVQHHAEPASESKKTSQPARPEAQYAANQSAQPAGSASQNTLSERPTTPGILDASAITTWPSAVKFISKKIATNEVLEAKIKRLIADQHKHEREWWTKREVIVNRHAGRAGNQHKAAELLRSLGGQYVPVAPTDPEADLAELDAFDTKVHKSLTQLVTHYDRELRQMGIPFFAIKHDLVILEEGKERTGASKGRLDRGELRQLQTRMLTYLEELFGEES